MRRIRLYTDQEITADGTFELSGAPAHHLLRVLRRRVGEHLVLFNGNGEEHWGEIISIDGRDACRVQLTETRRPKTESILQIRLVQAIGRGDRMDWALQKSVELGVHRIQPIMSERTEVRLSVQRAQKRLAHWHKVVISACEQSGRVRIPDIDPVISITELTPEPGHGLVLDPDARQTVADLSIDINAMLSLAIGPEGGFSDKELKLFDALGYSGLRLGPRILRTETAGPAALAILQSHHGDC